MTACTLSVIGGAPRLQQLTGSWLWAEDSGSGQHADHSDVTDFVLPLLSPLFIHTSIIWLVLHVLMSCHSPKRASCCCGSLSVIYFP